MAKIVTQIIEQTTSEDGREGTVTVITRGENGEEKASTREFRVWGDSKAEATEKATQDSLNK